MLISSCLAVAFDWTSAGAGLDIQVKVASGGTTYTGTIASGTYRILCGYGATAGGTTEPLADFLQVVAARLNVAILASGRTITVTLDTTGHVVIAIDSGTFDLNPKPYLTLLGFTDGVSFTGAGTYTATYQPKYLALMVSRYGGSRTVKRPGVWAVDDGGQSYGVQTSITTRRWEPTVDFVPRTPTVATAASLPATPCEPDEANASWTALGNRHGAWSWDDLFAVAGGKVCALSTDFQALRASTSSANTYALCAIDPALLTEHTWEPRDPAWPVFYRFTLPLIGYASPAIGTRS
jgi:hypothetical protein